MPEDEVAVEEEGGIKGALTRQLGPLQTWQWALVIVGGFILFRALSNRGGGSSSASGGSVSTTDSTGGGNEQDPFSGTQFQDVLSQLKTQSDQLASNATQISGLSTLAGLQQKLDVLLNTRSSILYYLNKDLTNINTYKDSLAKCTTTACRTKYKGLIAAAQKDYTSRSTQLTTVNNQINPLEAQIKQQTTTVQVAAPPATG